MKSFEYQPVAIATHRDGETDAVTRLPDVHHLQNINFTCTLWPLQDDRKICCLTAR
jgi:hypothetical protein